MNIEVNVSDVDLSSVIEDDGYGDVWTLGQEVAREIVRQSKNRIGTHVDMFIRDEASKTIGGTVRDRLDARSVERALEVALGNDIKIYIRQVIEGEVGRLAADFLIENINKAKEGK